MSLPAHRFSPSRIISPLLPNLIAAAAAERADTDLNLLQFNEVCWQSGKPKTSLFTLGNLTPVIT
jgi:hypothetical protein